MIEKADINDLEEVFSIYRLCDDAMKQQGYTYWDNYPKKHQTVSDINNGHLYKHSEEGIIKAVITLDEEQFFPWSRVHWKLKEKPLIVHRLAVHPLYQRKQLGHTLMHYAESIARDNNHTALRLDVSADNIAVNKFYVSLGYELAGTVYLPVRDYPFNCYEKLL